MKLLFRLYKATRPSEDEDEEVTTRVLSLSRCDTLDPATRTVTQIQVGPGQEMPGGHGEVCRCLGGGTTPCPPPPPPCCMPSPGSSSSAAASPAAPCWCTAAQG